MTIVNKMAGTEGKLRFKVYLNEGQRVAEIFVTPVTKCKDIVQRLQRQIHETDCFLIEVWQGCERLVPDNESILSTLLEWGTDLEDVKFYLLPREETPTYTQVVNGQASQKVNGFKEEPPVPLLKDVLLGGSRISVDELKEFAARQQQEIVAKERELKAKQIQLMEMKRKSKNKSQNPYIQQLAAKADEQDQRLAALRQVQDQVDSYKLSNSDLAEELENVRSLFMEKEKELAIAVAKVESLTQQLDKQRKGWSQSSPSREKTHQELELERLRKELMTRNELNHQQSVQIQSQKQLLAEKHKELFELDSQIDKYTNELRQKRAQNNHVTNDSGEQDFENMDYSNLSSFSKRSNKTNSTDSSSSRGRGRNARKLETLLEVEEEVSDGHASSKSSTEDLTQGPGPPRLSRVTALKSRFEAEGASEGEKSWNSHDRESRGNREGFSSPKRRVSPEGVETPVSPAPEIFDLDVERRKRDYSINEFLDISSLRINPPRQDIVTDMEYKTHNSRLQESAFEVPHSLEVKHIVDEFDLKSEEPCSTPSDAGDNSGASSPSSLSSTSSINSNPNSPKTAVFALTGVAKKSNSFPRLAEPTQHQNAERTAKAGPSLQGFKPELNKITESRRAETGLKLDLKPSSQGSKTELKTTESQRTRVGLKLDLKPSLPGLRTAQNQHGFQRVSNSKDFVPLRTEVEKQSGGVLASEESAKDFPFQADMVKSKASPTKNENVGSFERVTVLDFSRTGTKPKSFDGTSMEQNEATIRNDGQKSPILNEAKALDVKPDRISATNEKASELSSGSGREQVLNSPEIKTADSSSKNGKIQLSRLRYSPVPSLNSATPQQNAVNNNESPTRLDRKADKPSPNNKKIPAEETKMAVDFSLESNKRTFTNAPSPRLTPNLNEENDFKPSSGVQRIKEGQDKFENYETDNARSLPEDSSGTATVNRPQIPLPQAFKPISFRAKKLAAEQGNKDTSDNRSQFEPPISNSISIRGQSSSLTRITVTPAASYYSAKNSVNIPEKRSPVPTSKRQRFIHRSVPPSFPEVKDLVTNDELSSDASVEGIERKQEEIVAKESSDKETTPTNQEQGNKLRKTPRLDSKQVVSSFNIQLSSQSRKQIQEQKDLSLPSEQSKGSSSEGKQFNSESDRLSSESGRLQYGKGRLSPESGRLYNESSRLSSEGDRLGSESGRLSSEGGRLSSVNGSDSSLESSPTLSFSDIQNSSTVKNTGDNFREKPFRNMFTSSLLKPLLPSKQNSSPQQTEEILQSKEVVTINDFPLKITDVDTGIPVTVNGDIGLASQSNNPISDQSSNANFDNKANSALVNGDIGLVDKSEKDFPKENTASEKTAEVVLRPAQNNNKKKARHVSLDPHCVLLDAAVEGELDLVKHVIREVDDPSRPNTDGITALHNAVCASHDEVVHFLVEYGVNINSPDSHGWTPLHCAAANNATDLVRFLIEHGACIFAATSLEKKTPLQCCERGLAGYFNCMKYLNDVQQNFGLVNDGSVYALYAYSADEQDELSFELGEELQVLKRGDATEKEWWWAQNKRGESGYIPRNLLGLHPRISHEEC